ncbi:MAG: hypothetical protein RhofKO_27990 [Rhodothermales bacterium]
MLSALFVLMLVLSSSAYGQDQDRPNALKAGNWALLFQLDQPLGVSFFQGMVGLKYHSADDRAVRFGLGGRVTQALSPSISNVHVVAQTQYMIYPTPGREVNMYYGIGPQLNLSHSEQNRANVESTQTRLGAGMVGSLGAEWFATQHISIFAEYGSSLVVQVDRNRQRFSNQQPAELYTSRTSISYGMNVMLGLSAYF